MHGFCWTRTSLLNFLSPSTIPILYQTSFLSCFFFSVCGGHFHTVKDDKDESDESVHISKCTFHFPFSHPLFLLAQSVTIFTTRFHDCAFEVCQLQLWNPHHKHPMARHILSATILKRSSHLYPYSPARFVGPCTIVDHVSSCLPLLDLIHGQCN